jgi:amino acid permease
MDPNTVNTTQFGIYQSAPTALFFLLPMSLQRDMSAFRYVSLCSIAALLYTGVVLIIEFPSFNSHFKDITYSKPFYFDFDMFTGCSMTFFAFQC